MAEKVRRTGKLGGYAVKESAGKQREYGNDAHRASKNGE